MANSISVTSSKISKLKNDACISATTSSFFLRLLCWLHWLIEDNVVLFWKRSYKHLFRRHSYNEWSTALRRHLSSVCIVHDGRLGGQSVDSSVLHRPFDMNRIFKECFVGCNMLTRLVNRFDFERRVQFLVDPVHVFHSANLPIGCSKAEHVKKVKEHGLDHVTGLCRNLVVPNFKFISHGFSFLRGDNSLRDISLVANQDRVTFVDLVVVVHSQPPFGINKRCSICDVINNDGTKGVFQVAWDQRPVPFLSGRVPKLQPEGFAFVKDIFCQEVYPYGRLHQIIWVRHYWHRTFHECTSR